MTVTVARSELILGGQKSGKSRRAESLAQAWLARPGHRALLVATALAGDEELHTRIARHRLDRAARVPGLQTLEEPHHLAAVLQAHSQPDTLIVVDCLTLWLTNALMPLAAESAPARSVDQWMQLQVTPLLDVIRSAPGPVVLVSNEIGLGVIPLGREVRAFVDALGLLNQQVAQACERVTLMAAGLALNLKGAST